MGIYFQDGLKLWERLFVTMGVRFDDHSRFGNVSTYRFAPAYIFKNGTKLKATYGTGFKAPSLYQLYAPAGAWIPGGNVNLSPEKSTGWDIGVEQYLMNNSLTLGVTYFYNKFEDLIQFDWTNGYVNISQAETWGAELFLHYQVSRGLTVHGNYTYTKTRDNETGEKLIRRPDHKLNLNINCRLLKKVKTNIHFSYVGRRVDIYPYPERIEMDPYILINLFFSYDLKKNLQFFFRLDNLFNKDYEVVKGYGTAGRSFYLGFKTNF